MTVSATRQEALTPAKTGYARTFLSYVFFAFCVSLFLFPFMRAIYVGSDEGTFLIGAKRIVQGQVFARDFFEVMGPGSFYWMAAFFKLFGVTYLAGRLALFVPLLGTFVAIYYLSRKTCPRYPTIPCIILAGPYICILGQVESHHVDSNFFALLSVICLVEWCASRRSSLLIASGALAGITTCFLQPKGALLLAASMAWLWILRRKISPPLSQIAMLAGGFFAVICLVVCYFWSQGALGSLVYANYTFPSHDYGSMNSVPYGQGLGAFWDVLVTQSSGQFWRVPVAAVLTLPMLIVAILPALTLGFGAFYQWKLAKPEISLYALCGAALWASEIHRRDIHHIAYGSPLLIVLLIDFVGTLNKKLEKIAVQFSVFGAVILCGFLFLVAALVQPVQTTIGSVAAFGPGSATVPKFLMEYVRPGEDTFIYPYAPVYYFLSAATNPTPFSFMLHNYNSAAQYRQVVDVLEKKQVQFVVWDTNLEPRLLSELTVKPKPPGPDQLVLDGYLKSHYRKLSEDNGILMMVRK